MDNWIIESLFTQFDIDVYIFSFISWDIGHNPWLTQNVQTYWNSLMELNIAISDLYFIITDKLLFT